MGKRVTRGDSWECVVVDVATDSTTIYTGACRLGAIYVNTALSAHALPIKDGATTVFTIPASLAAGTLVQFWGAKFHTSLVVDPNDAATGNITVMWDPL
jgi:hypothetical protein